MKERALGNSGLRVSRLFERTVVAEWGTDGERWLTELPDLVAELAAAWRLTIGPVFGLSYNWVCAARRADGTDVVLKLGIPSAGHIAREAQALNAFAGRGATRLLKHDPERAAMLLERVAPGTPASALVPADDERATAAIVGVMRRLHAPPPPGCSLPDVAGYGDDLARHAGPLPHALVARAAGLLAELCADTASPVVLHGDLHHDNVLLGADGRWLAIDPHGVVGDPVAEVGAMLYNPGPALLDQALVDLVPRRVEQLADGLGAPVERVVAWGFVQAVLSEVWGAKGPRTRALEVARLLLPRLQ